MTKYGADVSDPFELAAALFVGENPDKLVYTVSREDKNVKAIIERTKETQNWLFDNGSFIEAYGQAAYFFAPLGGNVNLGMYQWMKSAGLYENVEIEEYLVRAQTAADKQRYFEIGRRLDAELAATPLYEERSNAIRRAEADRAALKLSNPYLEEALSGADGFGVTDEEDIIKNLSTIVEDSSAPLSGETRQKLQTALAVFNRGYTYITGNATAAFAEGSAWKRIMRDNVLADLEDISEGDPVLSQLLRSVFRPVLKFYSRDAVSASALQGPLG
jgi:ABC-type transport system substrate-binding protein